MSVLILPKQLALPGLSQRWREGDDYYRPSEEPINTLHYEIATVKQDGAKLAKGGTGVRAFIEFHHYSHSYVASRRRFALYRHGELVGAAVFSQNMQDASYPDSFAARLEEREARKREKNLDPRRRVKLEASKLCGIELGRLVLLNSVEGNGESWFVGECLRRLRREGFLGVLSFCDPVKRQRADGSEVMPGHHGGIYQSCNAHFAGRATGRTLHLFPDGTTPNERSVQKIRKMETGWDEAVAKFEEFGAPPFDPHWDAERRCAWVSEAKAATTTPMPHPGNWKYLFPLDHALLKVLPPNFLEYPPPPSGIRPMPKWGRRAARLVGRAA